MEPVNQSEDLYDQLYDDHSQSKDAYGHAIDTEQINEVKIIIDVQTRKILSIILKAISTLYAMD